MVFFIFTQILLERSVTNSGDPDQKPHNAASDLGLHCLLMSHKNEARLKWVNPFFPGNHKWIIYQIAKTQLMKCHILSGSSLFAKITTIYMDRNS